MSSGRPPAPRTSATGRVALILVIVALIILTLHNPATGVLVATLAALIVYTLTHPEEP